MNTAKTTISPRPRTKPGMAVPSRLVTFTVVSRRPLARVAETTPSGMAITIEKSSEAMPSSMVTGARCRMALEHGLLELDGAAEIAMDGLTEPEHILREQRLVEAKLLA